MKQIRFWDSVSTMLVLFGFGLYGAAATMASGRWYMRRLGASCWARSSPCAHSAAHFVTVILAVCFSPARKHTARIAAATCTRTEMFDSAVIFRYAGYDDHAKAGIP